MSEMLSHLSDEAIKSEVFGSVELSNGLLRCAAKDSAEEAWYRLEQDAGRWYISLVTADRWLSESIEADLMHYGDPIEELIEEELAELGWDGGGVKVEHYRSEDMLYTFRSPLPLDGADDVRAREIARIFLLAYEAAFRELGDMTADDEDA